MRIRPLAAILARNQTVDVTKVIVQALTGVVHDHISVIGHDLGDPAARLEEVYSDVLVRTGQSPQCNEPKQRSEFGHHSPQ